MMANEKRLIDANALMKAIKSFRWISVPGTLKLLFDYLQVIIKNQPTVDAVEVKPWQRLYNAHEVAEIISDLFGDACACNFNSIDEWLPYKCELQSACPNPVGVACWEQYLKYREAKMDGERKDNENP